jgi:hypothetical protein
MPLLKPVRCDVLPELGRPLLAVSAALQSMAGLKPLPLAPAKA